MRGEENKATWLTEGGGAMTTTDFSEITDLVISLLPVLVILMMFKWIIGIFGSIGGSF